MKKNEILDKIEDKNQQKNVAEILDFAEKAAENAKTTPETIQKEVKEMLEKHEIKAESVKGLTDFIEEKLLSISETVKKLQENQVFDTKTIKGIIVSAFKNEATVSALKNIKKTNENVEVLTIKAVGEITTGNVTTTTGGNAILDLINTNDVNMQRLASTFIENYATTSNTSVAVVPYADYLPKEGDVNFVLEGGTAGQVDLKIETRYATPKKAYGYEILTDDAIQDIPRLMSFAQQILLMKSMLKRQNGIIFGDGIGENPEGTTKIASAFDPASWTGNKIKMPNLLDMIRAAANQIYVTQNFDDEIPFMPNVAFVNPADWFAFIGTKTEEGVYVFPQFTFGENNKVDTFVVIPKINIPAGYIHVGDFSKLNIVNYINYQVVVGKINDQLIKGRTTIAGFTRFFSYVKEYDKKGFIYDTLANIEAGIKEAEL